MTRPATDADGIAVDRFPVPVPGEHLWIVMISYRVDPTVVNDPADMAILAENILATTGVLCSRCLRLYSPRVARRRCTGKAE